MVVIGPFGISRIYSTFGDTLASFWTTIQTWKRHRRHLRNLPIDIANVTTKSSGDACLKPTGNRRETIWMKAPWVIWDLPVGSLLMP